jgi:hypothetical protein
MRILYLATYLVKQQIVFISVDEFQFFWKKDELAKKLILLPPHPIKKIEDDVQRVELDKSKLSH